MSRARKASLPIALLWLLVLAVPDSGGAHPLGNFSISQYSGIRVHADAVELRYLVDMAEIPTFQEIQERGLVPEIGHPGLAGYLARRVPALTEGLRLAVDGRPLRLRVQTSELIFSAGAGGLPTLKLGVVYRAALTGPSAAVSRLDYRDGNFVDRAGWKEVIAIAGRGVTLIRSSVPATDRSRELADYPTDLLNSPPQDLEARVVFQRDGPSTVVAGRDPGPIEAAGIGTRSATPSDRSPTASPPRDRGESAGAPAAPTIAATGPSPEASTEVREVPLQLESNRQATPRTAFTELMRMDERTLGVFLFGLAVAAGLGAFHALEPGHGKTVVAAYLVGARGTARHAVLLGLVVTAAHTVSVYLLGAVTLYASRYVVPERLYPWLGVASGIAIAALGFTLFLRRVAGSSAPHAHPHNHDPATPHDHHHHHHGPFAHAHHPGTARPDAVTLPALVALGVTGGIVPCPAALVVLLSAIAFNRVGFGLLLIVAFSVGLAAVLIAVGLLMVYARRFMARFQGEGPLIQRWLPLASSAVITLVGITIAVQALMAAGILQIRL